MKRPVRLVQENDRLESLERRADAFDAMLMPIKSQLDEIHDLLFGAKAILWFLTKALAWAGGAVAIVSGLVLTWKNLH